MWNFINRNYWNTVIIVAVVLTVICGTTLILSGDTNEPSMAANAVNTVLTPIKSGFTKLGGTIADFFGDVAGAKNSAAENRKLKNQIKQLQNENERLEEYKAENERLRKLLEFKEKQGNYHVVPCEVVGRDFSKWNTEFVINRGTDQGVDVGAVVMENGGLVGNITMAGKNWAKVTTLLDSESSVSAMVIRSGAYGIVEGDIKLLGDNMCRFNYTAKDADIAIGDTLETSGLGTMYPAGIIIGKVKSVEQISGQIERNITVEISADIFNLREALVITSF